MSLNETEDLRELQKIMDALADEFHSHNGERREHSLTKADVMLIYRIAKMAYVPHTCPFKGEETGTLHSIAKNINATQKIATFIMVTGLVSAILSGVWFAIKHIVTEWVHTGGTLK